MKRLSLLPQFLALALALSICACSADDQPSDPTGAGGGGAGTTQTTDASSTVPMNDAAASVDQSVTPAKDSGAASDASSSTTSDAPKIVDAPAAPVDAPAACVKYCKCMAMNCAEQVFPTGCLLECSRQSNWDIECRQNMCNLAPVQTMNDHCTHAFGKFQCTDQ